MGYNTIYSIRLKNVLQSFSFLKNIGFSTKRIFCQYIKAFSFHIIFPLFFLNSPPSHAIFRNKSKKESLISFPLKICRNIYASFFIVLAFEAFEVRL